ncbi:MAG TPA: polyphosphate:AMP phosphotransferase [Acidobacteriota bacterium]|nr:polyphosphate:AMP phosphotransferase [Acidobacteriota bacterium]HNT17388.1 polyphosphate:AMP phosphotransferase [Acidobacteriota bacterium]HPA26303.1 polyphosphate:AMP phosphotransferase [Acidobacteriota bacterium]HQO19155.1 polyphosphate:AMP phosphotransferase [Acidobacteriota bacterium]HQQ46464.1 polyphosphate:AMP phosphotransferase [Acidobacteriota bacterium]
MFETAEVGNKISKSVYKKGLAKLREDILAVQKELAASKTSAIVIIGGVEGAGKTETVNQLLEWLDARGIETHALDAPTDEERERPPMWRFWRMIPPKGRMTILLGSWYTRPIVERTFGGMKRSEFDEALDKAVFFETMLRREGVTLVKFWLHVKEKTLVKSMKKLEKDPLQSWRVTKNDWKFVKKYGRFREVSEEALGRTNTKDAPWHIVEAEDDRYRNTTVARTLIAELKRGFADKEKAEKPPLKPRAFKPPQSNIFRTLDYTRKLDEKKYDKELPEAQAEFHRLINRMQSKDRSLILVFEGADAAGKGGAIRRVTQALNAKDYRVMSVAAPTDEEKARPYLWRFWRNLPRRDKVTVYDRSWYGRVLVEKIEGFCTDDEWMRAYSEINEFEKELSDSGIIVLKFYLSITAKEQLRRFKEREITPYKQYKITEEDWRNRSKWDSYEASAIEMFEKTSMPYAPWTVVEAEDKNFARIKVLKTIISHLKKEL